MSVGCAAANPLDVCGISLSLFGGEGHPSNLPLFQDLGKEIQIIVSFA